jgi:hypothetical protein
LKEHFSNNGHFFTETEKQQANLIGGGGGDVFLYPRPARSPFAILQRTDLPARDHE